MQLLAYIYGPIVITEHEHTGIITCNSGLHHNDMIMVITWRNERVNV